MQSHSNEISKIQTGINLTKINDEYFISKYGIGQITKEDWVKCSAKITAVFKGVDQPFLNVLKEYFFKNNFTNERMIDAVDHVIGNCQYPTPTVAQFISFDKKVKLFDYNQACDYVSRYGGDFTKWFESVDIDGKSWRVLK